MKLATFSPLPSGEPRPGLVIDDKRIVDIPAALPVPAGEAYTQKYWLVKPHTADVYAVDDQQLIGLPDNPAAAQVRVLLTVEGVPVELVRPIQHRYADRAQGERVRPVVVVPAVAVNLPVPVAVFPDGAARKVQVTVQANMPKAEGDLRLELPAGWKAGDFVWPLPKTLLVAGILMNYVYDGEVLLPQPIAIPADAKPGQTIHLKAEAVYQVCADTCVPGQETLTGQVPVPATPAPDAKWGPAIDKTLSGAPKPAGLTAALETGPAIKLAIGRERQTIRPDWAKKRRQRLTAEAQRR